MNPGGGLCDLRNKVLGSRLAADTEAPNVASSSNSSSNSWIRADGFENNTKNDRKKKNHYNSNDTWPSPCRSRAQLSEISSLDDGCSMVLACQPTAGNRKASIDLNP